MWFEVLSLWNWFPIICICLTGNLHDGFKALTRQIFLETRSDKTTAELNTPQFFGPPIFKERDLS